MRINLLVLVLKVNKLVNPLIAHEKLCVVTRGTKKLSRWLLLFSLAFDFQGISYQVIQKNLLCFVSLVISYFSNQKPTKKSKN